MLRFLELLSNYKEETAIRMQKRHENIVSQLKKELRKDGEEDKNKMIVSVLFLQIEHFTIVNIQKVIPSFLSECPTKRKTSM